MKFRIGTFYTVDSPYRMFLEEYLLHSCIKLDITPIIRPVKNHKDWHKNVAQKPQVILDILTKNIQDDERLVFLDADAVLIKYPKLFEEIPDDIEIAYHMLDRHSWYNDAHIKPQNELLTGTMMFRKTDAVIDLCKEWAKLASTSYEWEQKILQSIIGKHNLKTYLLPLEYCYIASLPNGDKPRVNVEEVIISHHQLSRLVKKGKIKL